MSIHVEYMQRVFQFHYDLILLCYKAIIAFMASRFQFHYDLILFFSDFLEDADNSIISISL